jgi:excisionase family DNA binding protein
MTEQTALPVLSDPPARPEPLLLDFTAAAALLGIGRTLLYEMHVDGRLGPLPARLGRRVLLRSAELRDWVAAGLPCRQRWQAQRGAGG